MARQLSIQPWRRNSLARRMQIFLAIIVPLPLVMLVALLTGIDPTMSFITIFVPVQLVAAAAVGYLSYGKRGIGDAALVVITTFLSMFVLILLASVLWSVISEGFKALSPQFIYQNNKYVEPTTSLEYGGVGHAILGTLLLVLLTTMVAVPLGFAMAIYLTQSQSKPEALFGPSLKLYPFTFGCSGIIYLGNH